MGDDLEAVLREADGITTVNYRACGHDRYLEGALRRGPAGSARGPTWWFVDLADPAKRTVEDLLAALAELKRLEAHAGGARAHGSEGRQVLEAIGGSWQGGDEDAERRGSGIAG